MGDRPAGSSSKICGMPATPVASPGKDYVIGLDVGGTSTRVLAIDLDGNRVAESRGAGGNPVSRGRHAAVRNVSNALAEVLSIVPADRVRSAVMGIAGISTLRNDDGTPLFDPMWRDMGLASRARLVADATVAFAAGTSQPSGTVLIAGTGAIATAIIDRTPAGRRSDGYGWLLGDLGSGFWLGREAVTATLRHIDGIGPGGSLVDTVLSAILPTETAPTVDRVITQVMQSDPVTLSQYAPLVTRAADEGDPLAEDIIEAAVDHLIESVGKIHTGDGRPIVLAGSLAASDTPVARRLRVLLGRRYPESQIRTATDGAAGAAWLAAADAIDAPDRLQRLHGRLFATRG